MALAKLDTTIDDRTAPRTAQALYLQDHVQRLHNEIESTTRKLELEKRRLNKLDEDVTRMRSEYENKVKTTQPKTTQKEESIRKMEHKLAQAISQLNSLSHENQDIREKIDMARRERLQSNQVFKKLQHDIRGNMSQVVQLQRDTDSARRDHEDRTNRIAALKKQLELERKNFKGTVQKLKEQMKEREREELGQRVHQMRAQGVEQDKKNRTRGLKAAEEEEFNASAVMRRILKLAFLNTIQRRHIRQHQKNIEVFTQAFATIKSTTGISDIEEIVKIFVALEQRNFSLLTYVNALNSEIESFGRQNRNLEFQLSSQRRFEEENAEKRKVQLTDLDVQIEQTTKAIQDDQLQTTQHAEIFDRCKPLISAILKTVEKENRGFGGLPAPEFTGENVLGWLTYIEKTLTQWKDFLPDVKDSRQKQPSKNYKYTIGNQVLALLPKKHDQQRHPLVKGGELPSAQAAFLEQGTQPRNAVAGREDDSSDEEEDLQSHPWTRQELRDKALAAVAKRKKHRKADPPGVQSLNNQQAGGAASEQTARVGLAAVVAGGDAEATLMPTPDAGRATATEGELGYDDMIEKAKENEDESLGSDDSDLDDDVGPTDEEINEIFLKRYKMSKEELQGMADKMGIQLNNLCYLKQEFDAYDEDRSGYIDVKELKGLLEKLGEELSDEELDQAFRELDSDNSGEIEFFEFVEWFTSED
mmetsp:Transcript_16257/g.35193  ORF Transcript_16257/g.35193 Transcript_16257/m.35193 type:complete len:701 (-) Transcript_16257:62-2164(-)|eukprot:CAMPEP_0206484226 /NCGR_PEP_ID=MMETSP0324_2-20121206/39861_1 /ASSEMBLY_ACC=CAM_ASM_000836 /TAXON_ID=2866 /ORGANISM="Crypthecodinium cohnii, Strain Seligo" /LENGTH=700 /DNA_ID=CAMNT_0053962359 /DNA_START=329 /DNA_END=2431 /DNA_ORIENTATION=-